MRHTIAGHSDHRILLVSTIRILVSRKKKLSNSPTLTQVLILYSDFNFVNEILAII